MRYLTFLLSLCLFSFSAEAEDRNFVSLEYAPFSEHLTDDEEPDGGYNEDNNIVTVKYGRLYPVNEKWSYALTAGFTFFDNSYDKESNGPGIGIEGYYDLADNNWNLYGGADLGIISGYEDNVDEDYQIFGDRVPFLVFNGGAEYDFDPDLPTLRAGLKFVPGGLFDSDNVIAVSVGTRYRF